MSRVRLLAAISLIVALAVALVVVLVQQRSSDRTAPVAVSAASEPASPGTAPPPEPVVVPTPDNTGRDFDHIWREIQRFADWTYTNPEVGLRHIHLIYHPECPCFAKLKEDLSLLVRDGVYLKEGRFQTESIVVNSDLGDAVLVQLRASTSPAQVANAQGEVLETAPALPPRTFKVILEVQDTGRWLARSIELVEN